MTPLVWPCHILLMNCLRTQKYRRNCRMKLIKHMSNQMEKFQITMSSKTCLNWIWWSMRLWGTTLLLEQIPGLPPKTIFFLALTLSSKQMICCLLIPMDFILIQNTGQILQSYTPNVSQKKPKLHKIRKRCKTNVIYLSFDVSGMHSKHLGRDQGLV